MPVKSATWKARIGENQGAFFLEQKDKKIILLLFFIAVVLYSLGILWGLPFATAPDRIHPWGNDELAPLGSLAELYNVFVNPKPGFNPQYPLLQYILQAVVVGPYALWLWVTGGLPGPSAEYPFGLTDPVGSLAVMTVLARLVSLVMAAGVVVLAYITATVLSNRRTGIIAGILVLLMYPMFYYSRTSNVDMGLMFWTSLGIAIYAICLRDSLTPTRAVCLGVVAAFAIATKDAGYAAFLMIAVPLLIRHLHQSRQAGSAFCLTIKPLWLGLLTSVGVYLVASGFVFHPGRYLLHLIFIFNTSAQFLYPATVSGFFDLFREVLVQLRHSLGFWLVVFAFLGILLSFRYNKKFLLLALPALGVLVGTILPVHFVKIRFVLIIAYLMSLFAAYAFSTLLDAQQAGLRKSAAIVLVLLFSWSLIRGGDLTHQMVYDSRYELAIWFSKNANPGDRVGYFGAPEKLPALPLGVVSMTSEDLCTAEDWASEASPEFVVIIPTRPFENIHEYSLSQDRYDAFVDGSLGYHLAVQLQTRTLFTLRPISFVNPPVKVFIKKTHLSGMSQDVEEINEQEPILYPLERLMGTKNEPLRGMYRNTAKAPEPC